MSSTGAEPVFVDCDPATGNIDVPLLADLLSRLRAEGRRLGAVMPVDMLGCSATGLIELALDPR